MVTTAIQRGASAGGDIIGRDKLEIHNHASASSGVVGKLLDKLQAEMQKDAKVRHTIESLARFHARRPSDGIVGLEAKLEAGGRSAEYIPAIEKKEMFAKLLERWSLYLSAQEIFAYLLARAEYHFNYTIQPQIGNLTVVQVNELIEQQIIVPTIEQCGANVFVLDYNICMGMVYWLAEQCFVRWHQ